MIIQTPKIRPHWLRLPKRHELRWPLLWLVLLVSLIMLGGVFFVAQIALHLAWPDGARYGGNVGNSGQADYSQWPFGTFRPPINPEAVNAAEADQRVTITPNPNAPTASAVPVARIDVAVATATPTPTPPLVTAVPLATTVSTPVPPMPTPRSVIDPTAAATVAPILIATPRPVFPPTFTRIAESPTPVLPSPTPFKNPDDTQPSRVPVIATNTSTVPRATSTPTLISRVPTTSPVPTASPQVGTSQPSSPTPEPSATSVIPTPSPSPTLTPVAPSAGFVDQAIVIGEASQGQLIVRLSQTYHVPVKIGYKVIGGTATRDLDYVLADGTLTFPAAGNAGSTDQVILIKTLADNLHEPNETIIIKLIGLENASISGADQAVVTITDGNVPPTVRFANTEQTVPERGTAAVTIMLSQVSAIPVVVPYSVSGTASPINDYELRSGTVIIPAGSTSVRLRFPITDDQRDEANETVVIRLGTPTNADLDSPSTFVLTISDDDTFGVQVLTNTTTISEGGSFTYTVRLLSEPTSQVAVRLQPDAQLNVAPSALAFNASNWAIPQLVTVTAIDDNVAEASIHQGLLRHEVTSFDPNYNWSEAQNRALDVVAHVLDNDTAGVELRTTSTMVSEGLAISYTVRLTSEPTAPVTLTLLPDDQVTVGPLQSLSFNANNWNIPQTVVVTAIDDFIDEDVGLNWPPHRGRVSHLLTSADPNYNQGTQPFTVPPIELTIIDNDEAGVTVLPVTLDLAEGGPTGSYGVRLTSQPTASVTITLTPNAEVNVAPTSLVFTPANWANSQTVMVTAIDDQIDEDGNGNVTPHMGLITHTVTSADPLYANLIASASPATVQVRITDNDTAGVELLHSPTTVVEGGTVTYTLRLTSQPLAAVTVHLNAATSLISPTLPAAVSFSPTTWMTPTTITVRVRDNLIDELYQTPTFTVTHWLTSSDPNYDGINDSFSVPNLPVTVLDDDTAGVSVTPVSLTLAEGGPTGSYGVHLTSEPTAPVTITLTTDNQVNVAPATLIFTPANWAVTQTVTVTATNDNIDEDGDLNVTPHYGLITHTVASADPFYANLPATEQPTTVQVHITDNDTAGVELLHSPTTVVEGGTVTYTLRLTSQPLAAVTVHLNAATSLISPTLPATVSFSPTNWMTPITITVRVRDNLIDELYQTPTFTVTHWLTSSDPNYDGINDSFSVPTLPVTVLDNDTAGVSVTPVSLTLAEGGPTGSYGVRLTSEPTAPVTITLTPDNQVSVAPATLIFTPANWAVTQTVTVTATDDQVYEGPHTGLITHTVASADPFYANLPGVNLPVSIRDNDTAGIIVTPVTLDLAEGGANGNYGVVLRSQPTAAVTITLMPDNQVSVVATELVFTPANWAVTQTVTVTAIDDNVDEDGDGNITPHNGLITHTVASADPIYANLPATQRPADVQVAITDNDTAGVSVTPTALNLAEGGANGSYGVHLTSQPTAPVTVTLLPDNQVSVAPTTLIFTPASWAVTQTVTVTATDDLVDEDGNGNATTHNGLITHTVSSADPFYASLTPTTSPAAVVVTITDNDTAGVELLNFPPSVVEGGTFTYTLRLTSQPLAAVTISVTATNTSLLSPTLPIAVTFSPTNWMTPTTVTIEVPDNLLTQIYPSPTLIVSHTLSSTDQNYNAGGQSFSVPAQPLTIIDNDEPVVVSVTDALPVSEGPASVMTFTVSLSRPSSVPITVNYATADGTATIADGDYVTANGTITFETGQTSAIIPVTINNDPLVEADENFILRLTGVNPSGDVVNVGNSDAVGVIVNDDSWISTPRFIFTGGPSLEPREGYPYSPVYSIITLPCSWPLDRPISFELWSPAMDAGVGGSDAPSLTGAGNTQFALFAPDENPLVTTTFPPTNNAPAWMTFHTLAAPVPCGEYRLSSSAMGNDVNNWALRVGYDHDANPATPPITVVPGTLDRISLALRDATVGHTTDNTPITAWVYVAPGSLELRLRNFDMDGPPVIAPETWSDPSARVTYYSPSATYDSTGLTGGITGSVSQSGVWSNYTVINNPEAGWWRIVTNTQYDYNHYVIEATDQAGNHLPLRYDPPLGHP